MHILIRILFQCCFVFIAASAGLFDEAPLVEQSLVGDSVLNYIQERDVGTGHHRPMSGGSTSARSSVDRSGNRQQNSNSRPSTPASLAARINSSSKPTTPSLSKPGTPSIVLKSAGKGLDSCTSVSHVRSVSLCC